MSLQSNSHRAPQGDPVLDMLLKQGLTQKQLKENIQRRPSLWRGYSQYMHLLPR